MKKLLTVLAFILMLALSVSAFAACGGDADNSNSADDASVDGNKITVSWYQGSKLLKEETIDKGGKATSWTPESEENKTFDGWYAEASLTTPFDFETVLEADTDIFAKFKSDEYVADENSYYLIGAGAGDMGKANWDHTNAAANLTMTKEEVANANVYSITITMYAGDMFQICYGGSWDGQVGIGFVDGAEYCDGVNFYDNNEYKADDKKVAQVKNAEGNVVFIGSDEYNKGYETWNVKLAEGMDGKYKITYTTYPAAKDYNKITFELVEKLDAMTVTHDMHFIGTMNEWGTTYEEGQLALTPSDDKSTWSGIIEITEDMYADWTADDAANTLGVKCAALKLYNVISGGYYSPDGNNIFLTAGTYAFKYTVDGDKVEYQALDYYLVGTFVDAEGKAVNYAVKEGVTPKMTVADGVATGTLVATDVTAMGDYSWIADQGKPGVFAIKPVYGCELGIQTWYSDDANNGDNFYVAAGTYTVTVDIESGAVTITPAE
ncbi:MAG: InlB B-repeat-containing protein [Clostridia bacterium]|nr:InlB B-repeat-containing protein [Clostridia bacterium]